MPKIIFYLPGIALILFGLVVLFEPRILVAIVATTLIMSGVSLLGVAYRMLHAARGTTTIDWRRPE